MHIIHLYQGSALYCSNQCCTELKAMFDAVDQPLARISSNNISLWICFYSARIYSILETHGTQSVFKYNKEDPRRPKVTAR